MRKHVNRCAVKERAASISFREALLTNILTLLRTSCCSFIRSFIGTSLRSQSFMCSFILIYFRIITHSLTHSITRSLTYHILFFLLRLTSCFLPPSICLLASSPAYCHSWKASYKHYPPSSFLVR